MHRTLVNLPGIVVATMLIATGCAGNPTPGSPPVGEVTTTIAAAADERLRAELARVIVPEGPGTWAEGAAWDEYLFRLRNNSGERLRIERIVVVDYLDAVLQPSRGMVRLTEGIAILSGIGSASLPAGAGTGEPIPRIEERRIAQAIRDRTTRLPVDLAAGDVSDVNLFFALAPWPRRIEIGYTAGGESATLTIDTNTALRGLHLNVIER